MNLCKTCGTICPFDDERTECDAYAPMTNENWFISLPTEEKAHFLSVECARAMCEQQLKITNRNTVDYWKMWLKQPTHRKGVKNERKNIGVDNQDN